MLETWLVHCHWLVNWRENASCEEIPEICGEFYCVTNSDLHEENLSFSLQLPEGWKISGSSTVDFNGSKVAECYMKCGESYEDWLNEKMGQGYYRIDFSIN